MVQIEIFTINIDIDSNPVGRVQNFGKIFGIAILPPANAGFVGVINPCHIASAETVAAVFFFEVCTLPTSAISNTEQTFSNAVFITMKSFFDDLPLVVYDVVFHTAIFLKPPPNLPPKGRLKKSLDLNCRLRILLMYVKIELFPFFSSFAFNRQFNSIRNKEIVSFNFSC